MDDEKRRLRDEVADLSKAVRDLREQLAGQDTHHCHGCHCAQPVWVWPYIQPTYPVPIVTYPHYQTICGNTSVAPGVPNATVTYTNVGGDTSTALGAINYS